MKKLGMSFAGLVLAWVAVGCSSTTNNNNKPDTSSSGGTNSSSTAGMSSSNGGTGTMGTSGSVTGTTGTGTTGTATGTTSSTTGAGGATTTGTMSSTGVGGGATTTAGGSGGSGGGGFDVVRPSLVTSGQNNYWQIGMVTEGGTNANFTVNSGQAFQVMHGWGGTFNEQGWAALQALGASDVELAMKLLFHPAEGIGFDWGRIPMGPSDYAVARYTLSTGPGDFSVEHDRQYLIPFIKAAQAVKPGVKYWASPWTPPPWAKTGTTEKDGYDKGIFNSQYYSQYADFFVSWIQAYEAEGIPINAVMPQNEPGWAQSYPTCAWGPATDSTNNTEISGPVTLGTFVDAHLFPALDAAGLQTDVWFGTLSNNTYFPDYWNDMASKPTFSRIVGGALQWETINSINTVIQSGKIVMQSEHRCGNYPWLSEMASSPADANRNNFLASMAPNNHAYGEESWDLMKQWIDAGAQIYSAWNMVLDTGGFNLDEVRRWPQNAMLAVDKNAGTLQVTAYYYVFRHIAQYVDEGATRIGVNGNALAFKNPDNSIVTIMFNEGNSPAATTLSVDGTMMQFEIPARGWATVSHPAG